MFDPKKPFESLINMQKVNREARLDQLDQFCLIEAFFRKEAEKPAHMRRNYCHISCPCRKCTPCM